MSELASLSPRRRFALICITAVALAVLSVLALSAAQVRASAPMAQGDTSERLDSILTAASRRLDFQGSVLISRKGRVLLRNGYGYADAARHIRNSVSHLVAHHDV